MYHLLSDTVWHQKNRAATKWRQMKDTSKHTHKKKHFIFTSEYLRLKINRNMQNKLKEMTAKKGKTNFFGPNNSTWETPTNSVMDEIATSLKRLLLISLLKIVCQFLSTQNSSKLFDLQLKFSWSKKHNFTVKSINWLYVFAIEHFCCYHYLWFVILFDYSTYVISYRAGQHYYLITSTVIGNIACY